MMIRQPSTREALLAWHTAELNGERPPRHDGDPQCGWYKMRMVKHGPWVPAMIWCDRDIDDETGELTRDEVFRGAVNGLKKDPVKIWTYLRAISREDYDKLVEYRLYNSSMMDERKPIDLSSQPTPPSF